MRLNFISAIRVPTFRKSQNQQSGREAAPIDA
jgi:hypothetical protein